MAAPAENPDFTPRSPDDRATAYRCIWTAIERASLARQIARVLGQPGFMAVVLEQLELTDEETAWLRDHPGDYLSPGQPPRLSLGTLTKPDDDSGPTMVGRMPSPATS